MVRPRSCRAAVQLDAIPLSAPAQWREAVRPPAAILPEPASYGYGSKGGETDGWHPLPAEKASEKLPAKNNDAPMPRVLATVLPSRARKSDSFQARAAVHFSTARIELRRADARSS